MSQTIAAPLKATLQSATPTVVALITITRLDLAVFRWAGHDADLEVDGDLFLGAPGVDLSSLVSSEGFAPDNAEITALERGGVISRADVIAGLWWGATVELAQCDFKAATKVRRILKVGTVGQTKVALGYSVLEFRDPRQAIQGAHEAVLQPTCRYQFGVRNAVSHCPVDLAANTGLGSVTSTASGYEVTDTGRLEVDDWWGEGVLTFTSGANAGYPGRRIKSFEAGSMVFWEQFVFPIEVGDEYTVTPGCRLRPFEDCRDKWNAMIDFGGEYNPRSPDSLTAPAV